MRCCVAEQCLPINSFTQAVAGNAQVDRLLHLRSQTHDTWARVMLCRAVTFTFTYQYSLCGRLSAQWKMLRHYVNV